MLQVKNLSLSFLDGTMVFKDISFDIKENAINLITGKSGCGKSSLLMCLARVIPDIVEGTMTGEIILNGENIEHKTTEAIAGTVAYMFQDPDSQLCTFTVEDEIAFGLENMNVDVEYMEEIIDYYLDMVNIKHLKKRELNKLSGGEKQKVALAAILAIEPQIILMDEPTANLDPTSRDEMVELIKRLRDEMGRTIVLIEHNIDEFRHIIDNVIVVENKGVTCLNSKCFIDEYDKSDTLPKRVKYKNNLEKTLLEVKNLSFSYDRNYNVLDNINFSLKQGDITAIVGHNGAGKSTLTKLIIGFLKNYNGSILLNNKEVSQLHPKEIGEMMGLVFQNPEHQFVKMSVEKELSFSLEARSKDKEYITSRTKEYLYKFDLFKNKDANPFELSQGQKRRLSTASMMINGQELLILDEPTYGQDKDNLKELIELLYEVNNQGTSILIITHDMNLVNSCCDNVICIEKGKIAYSDDNMRCVNG
ncbi:ABC transporter ATP-binding protein [Clostridium sp.]|uniref:ABC transporter ATP-binding protein n=1 Tax=Clostridium sp. TaxID=1506 RepID=UPI003F2EA081